MKVRMTVEPAEMEGEDLPAGTNKHHYAGVLCLFYARTLVTLLALVDGDRAQEKLDHSTDYRYFGEVCSLLLTAAFMNFEKADDARRAAEEKGGTQ